MVLSTAGSPLLVGVVLDGGGGLEGLLLGAMVSVVAGAALSLKVFPRSQVRPRLAEAV